MLFSAAFPTLGQVLVYTAKYCGGLCLQGKFISAHSVKCFSGRQLAGPQADPRNHFGVPAPFSLQPNVISHVTYHSTQVSLPTPHAYKVSYSDFVLSWPVLQRCDKTGYQVLRVF